MSAEQQEQKQIIIERLKEDGCRITKQRLMLLDIILEDECSSCKEIITGHPKRPRQSVQPQYIV